MDAKVFEDVLQEIREPTEIRPWPDTKKWHFADKVDYTEGLDCVLREMQLGSGGRFDAETGAAAG